MSEKTSDRHMHDFGGKYSQVYSNTCECGKVFEVSTQEDAHPEYYTDVFIRCECGKSVRFTIPVN